MTDVKPGQVWADNDPRSVGRTLRVERIEGGKAVCTVLTNADEVQEHIDRIWQEAFRYTRPAPRGMYPSDRRGKEARISLARFKPIRTGYRKIRDTQYGIRYDATGPVFAFRSREDAETELVRDGRGIGVLVVHEYEPGTPNCTEWREVED